MSKPNIQDHLDKIISFFFLWFIPRWVKPNHLSIFRIISVPFVFYLLYTNNFFWGFIAFAVAASTDFIDGAMARTRNQITYLGKILDPIADKFLIAAALSAVAFEYILVQIFIVFIIFEIISTITGAFLKEKLGKSKGANTFGKIKMVLQSISVILFILALLISSEGLRYISNGILFVALIFAAFSAYGQIRERVFFLKNTKETSS